MSVNLSGAGWYSRTSHWASGTNGSCCAWVRSTSLPGGGGAGNYRIVGGFSGRTMFGLFNNGNVRFSIMTTSADYVGTATPVVNTWYHMGLTKSGNSKVLYVNGVQEATGSDAAAAQTSLLIGDWDASDTGDEWVGNIAFWKDWTVTLTADEMRAEARQGLPVKLANLNAYYPFWDTTTAITAYAPSTKNLTSGGSGTTTGEGPPVPWSRIEEVDDAPYVATTPPPPSGNRRRRILV